MNVVGIIPARYGSKRFPGKPLAHILNKPLIQWVWERVKSSKCLTRLIIATDDMRISNVAKGFGAEVVLTSRKHKSGTDRIAQVCRNLRVSIVVNIQGDEPLIPLDTIASVVRVMVNNPKVPMATAVCKSKNSGDATNPNIVKVILDRNNYAMYFSRSPIPHNSQVFYKHIGIYAYRRNFLLEFVKLKESKLEQTEKLEQLRALENGYKIKVAVVKNDSIPVDVPEDIKKVEEHLCMTKLARN